MEALIQHAIQCDVASHSLLSQAMAFKQCLIGTRGPKVCQENIPHTRGLHWDWDPRGPNANLAGVDGFTFPGDGSGRSKIFSVGPAVPRPRFGTYRMMELHKHQACFGSWCYMVFGQNYITCGNYIARHLPNCVFFFVFCFV